MQPQELQKRLPLIIAVACGILAILLLNVYLKKREEDIVNRVKQAQQRSQPVAAPRQMAIVLVASKDIPTQVPITPSDIAMREIPVEYIQPGTITSLDQIIGQIASSPIAAGEQMLQTKLMPPGNIGKTLSEITPTGKRAVAITVDNISDISSLIQPGDHVDVFAFLMPPSSTPLSSSVQKKTETSSAPTPSLVPIFQNVEILAVGNEFVANPEASKSAAQQKEQTARGANSSKGTVTFALSPQEAVLISFVQEHGKIRLVLRSTEDAQKETIKPADWDTLFQYLYPDRAVDAEGKRPTVEIYRGLRKEVIPLFEKGK